MRMLKTPSVVPVFRSPHVVSTRESICDTCLLKAWWLAVCIFPVSVLAALVAVHIIESEEAYLYSLASGFSSVSFAINYGLIRLGRIPWEPQETLR